jgi:CheY-like chemotaxis protein
MEYTHEKPDIVTMDISMPVMDGILALKMILSRFPDAKIIVISALDKKNMVFTALESGARNYILKPIDEAKLVKTIETVLKDDKPRKAFRAPETGEQLPGQSFNLDYERGTPFSIDNRNGTLVINIKPNINPDNFMALGSAVQGFLYIKPLSLIFNFGNTDEIDDGLLERIKKLVSAVKVVGGSVKFAATGPDLQDRLNRKMPEIDIIPIA